MTISLLYGCCQVETCARDLREVRSFMYDALGAGTIEQVLAKQIDAIIPDEGYGCDHIGLGDAVFQVNQPVQGMSYKGQESVHAAYLESNGPCVTNLNYFVDDIAHAKSLLMEMGAGIHIEGPSSAALALSDYGPENTREGADDRPFLFMATRHLIGLDLEIMEPNFLRFCDQDVQYPAFVQPRPKAGDGNLLLERLRIVVPDLEQTHRNLVTIFAPAGLSRPYDYREGPSGRSFRAWLGGIEIEYCQPVGGRGVLHDHLDARGAGVVAIDFGAQDLDAVLEKCGDRTPIDDEPDWLGDAVAPHRRRVACREPIGFDAILADLGKDLFPAPR